MSARDEILARVRRNQPAALLPILYFFDGFRTSHEENKIAGGNRGPDFKRRRDH